MTLLLNEEVSVRCFYCAEDIKDEAVVCRFCGRDLLIIRAVSDRFANIERQIYDLLTQLTDLRSVTQPKAEAERDDKVAPAGVVRLVVPAAASSVTSSILYFMFREHLAAPILQANKALLLASIFSPLPFGSWAGLWSRGRHPGAYLLCGAFAGLGAFLAASVVAFGSPVNVPMNAETVQFFSYYVLGSMFLFTTGGLVGDRMQERIDPSLPRHSYAAEVLARGILGGKGRSAQDALKIKRFADAISAMAPLLTFIGSLITGYLTYKAALLKPK